MGPFQWLFPLGADKYCFSGHSGAPLSGHVALSLGYTPRTGIAVMGRAYLLGFSWKFLLGSAWGPGSLEEPQEVMKVSERNSLSLCLQGSSRDLASREAAGTLGRSLGVPASHQVAGSQQGQGRASTRF